VIDAALKVFGAGSYSGATTAEIARQAGITEPILYRHFGSKRDLYIACLDEMLRRLRKETEEIIASEPDPREWTFALPRAIGKLCRDSVRPNELWMQALTSAGEDEELRKYLRRHLREVHIFVTGVIRRAQEAGGVASDRDPDAEAWIGIAIGLLRAAQDRVGGLLRPDDVAAIMASRRLSLLPPT
jgi:AcrR family transcriptional regulator